MRKRERQTHVQQPPNHLPSSMVAVNFKPLICCEADARISWNKTSFLSGYSWNCLLLCVLQTPTHTHIPGQLRLWNQEYKTKHSEKLNKDQMVALIMKDVAMYFTMPANVGLTVRWWNKFRSWENCSLAGHQHLKTDRTSTCTSLSF